MKERVLAYYVPQRYVLRGREALRNKNDWNVETTKEHTRYLAE